MVSMSSLSFIPEGWFAQRFASSNPGRGQRGAKQVRSGGEEMPVEAERAADPVGGGSTL
jgi:hypothetical protein